MRLAQVKYASEGHADVEEKLNFCLRMIAVTVLMGMISSNVNAEESKLSEMISPVTNPVNFEDPRIQSSIRPIFMFHKLPSEFLTGSGDIQLWAAQVRFALTDRLALLATKDGFIQINADEALPDSEGAANLAGGLQHALLKDDTAGSIATAGLRYEWQTGDPEVFQGTGDGILSPHLSGALTLGPVNLMGYTDLRLGINDEDSDFWDASLHVDYPLQDFYPSLEINMVHVLDAGNRIPLTGEGFDLVNFGSAKSEGSTVLTLGVGGRYRVSDCLDLGASYEFPLTDREDIFAWRLTADAIVRFDFVAFDLTTIDRGVSVHWLLAHFERIRTNGTGSIPGWDTANLAYLLGLSFALQSTTL